MAIDGEVVYDTGVHDESLASLNSIMVDRSCRCACHGALVILKQSPIPKVDLLDVHFAMH